MEWLKLTEERRKQIVVATARRRGMIEEAVEKDWWVTMALKAAFVTEWAGDLVFKGGTSLSKGWDLIERFSEDIDLSINRSALEFQEEFVSNSQLSKLRKKASAFVAGPFKEGLQQALEKIGINPSLFELTVQESTLSDRDPQVLELSYVSVMGRGGYLRDRVIIEVGARSLREPFSQRPIQSIIGATFPNEGSADAPFSIPVVEPKRTFLEKAFLLHEGFLNGADTFTPDRKSRHLYDLERLMDTSHAEAALQEKDLYNHIVQHRQQFTPVRGLSYDHHVPSLIKFLPPTDGQKIWEEDYQDMRKNMIYGSPPDFVLLMLRLAELQVRFRLVGAAHDLPFLKNCVLRRMAASGAETITQTVVITQDPFKPATPKNQTIQYKLTLVRYQGTWYFTAVEIVPLIENLV